MFPSIIRRAASAPKVIPSVHSLLPKSVLPPSVINKPGNLYQVLSRNPDGGVGRKVHQVRWGLKHIEDCYWLITRTSFKNGGNHGKAWGKLHWRGKPTTPEGRDERIRGALKYSWKEGESKIHPGSEPIGKRLVIPS